MKDLFVVLLIFAIASPNLCANADLIFNVVDYGAVGDGTTDDSDVCFNSIIFFILHAIIMILFN